MKNKLLPSIIDFRKENIKNRIQEKIRNRPKKICLFMIVKNESRNMVRLLNSLKEIMDMASILDTGSTDSTIQVITDWFSENQYPFKIHQKPFINFAESRTQSFELAKKSFPNANYFLTSDADFIWCKNPLLPFNKNELTEGRYLIEQKSDNLTYKNLRLFRSDIDWECVGVTHEFWDNKQSNIIHYETKFLNSIYIRDMEDGGCKSDKFERDERLLRNGILDPKTEKFLKHRYTFYLANTLRDVNKCEEAIEYYLKTIEDVKYSFDEEIYNSYYSIGRCYQSLYIQTKNKTYYDKCEFFYKKSFSYRPTRTEGLYKLCIFYFDEKEYEKSLKVSMIGSKIKFPENDFLFVEYETYEFLFDFQIIRCCYQFPKYKNLGIQISNKLLTENKINKEYRMFTENILSYIETL
jgi:tetratricopeptide (TPR) repeat protein